LPATVSVARLPSDVLSDLRVLILFLDHEMRDQLGQSRAATRARKVRAIETLQQLVRQAMEVFDR
jgi:hypothetical protein